MNPRDIDLMLVINGDIITSIDFVSMIRFHMRLKCDFSVAVRNIRHEIPFGVVDLVNDNVFSISEKPSLQFNINAGIYLMNKDLLRYIAPNQYLDATDFIKDTLLPKKHQVKAFMITEYWTDIGRHEELQAARILFEGPNQ
jgi:NDP-sugar pyrophosphorylase family protein